MRHSVCPRAERVLVPRGSLKRGVALTLGGEGDGFLNRLREGVRLSQNKHVKNEQVCTLWVARATAVEIAAGSASACHRQSTHENFIHFIQTRWR